MASAVKAWGRRLPLPPGSRHFQTPADNGSAQNLRFLYPYDKTVWPRGMLAPLLQWGWTTGDADAIQIKLATASGSFSWTGTFGRPAILATTGGKFIRHPIPQDIWQAATDTAGGPTLNGLPDTLTVSLVVLRANVAHGPISETWSVAPGRLAGTVYYNSYGTQLVKNSIEKSWNNGPQFGAAVLAIRSGDTGPSVVAGTPSALGSGAGCTVCHVVSGDGSRLIAQHGDVYSRTSRFDLKNSNAETVLTNNDGLFGWAGLSRDGALALTNSADLASGTPSARLYSFPPGATAATPLAVTGIPNNLKAGTPAFSPDGKHVAFDFLGGTIGTTTGDGTKLAAMDFNSATNTFTNLKVLADMGATGHRAGFPSFFPTNDGVAYHYQLVNSNHRYNTWHQAQAQIWWSDLATGTPTMLGNLNGVGRGQCQVSTHRPQQPRRRYSAQLRAYGQSGGNRRVCLGCLREPAALRQCRDNRSLAERSAELRRHSPRQCDHQEALGSSGRSQSGARHGPESPGLLPSRAGVAGGQFPCLLGARSLSRRRGQLCNWRPVLRWVLSAHRGGVAPSNARTPTPTTAVRACRRNAAPRRIAVTPPTCASGGFCSLSKPP